MKIKVIKFTIITIFLLSFAYVNKDKIPMPKELKTLEFIITGGVDIDRKTSDKNNMFSISYIGSEGSANEADKSNENKHIFNVKSDTMNKTVEKLRDLTNKSINDSHLKYMLIGEETAKNSLEYFIDYYSKNSNIRLDVYTFITKDMTSEEFIKKILTSQIDVNARLDGFVNDKTKISSMTKKNLKDIMQIFYTKEKTGLLPVISIKENPVTNAVDNEKNENQYTFEFFGLGIIKNGKLIDYMPYSLVKPYLILTKSLKMTDIEIKDEKNNLYVYTIKNSNTQTIFKFDKSDIPKKVIFNINLETELIESSSKEKSDKNNKLQSEKIKEEVEEVIKLTKKTNADFLNIGEILSIRYPYKWHTIKNDWQNIFENIEYEINVSVKGR